MCVSYNLFVMNSQSCHLVDKPFQYFMNEKLNQCHTNRTNIYYYVFNVSILLIFIGVVVLILFYSHKNKLSDVEKQRQLLHDQQYVLSKIRFYKDEMNKKDQMVSNITQLPVTNMERF